MALFNWSTTAANNANADPTINWAEGQPPSSVNDSARAMMAAVAAWFVSPEWLNYGLTPTFVSATQFTVTGNQTTIYSVGRRVRAFVSAGTVYGTVTASAFTSLTTVTVTLDSGNLDSGISEVDVGIINPAYPSLPNGFTESFTSPGWAKYPSGEIRQWGVSATVSGGVVVPFPIPFPNACLSIELTVIGFAGYNGDTVQAQPLPFSTTSFAAYGGNPVSGAGNVQFSWVATGF